METTTLAQCLAVVAATAALAGTPVTAEVFVYPQKGQSQEQQNKDSSECSGWAKNQSGVDPAQPPPQGRPGGAVRGGARGAAMGAAVGGIAGDAGKGAAAGAVVGGVGGRRRAKVAQQEQQQASRSSYDRAFGACMEGRGYTVR